MRSFHFAAALAAGHTATHLIDSAMSSSRASRLDAGFKKSSLTLVENGNDFGGAGGNGYGTLNTGTTMASGAHTTIDDGSGITGGGSTDNVIGDGGAGGIDPFQSASNETLGGADDDGHSEK